MSPRGLVLGAALLLCAAGAAGEGADPLPADSPYAWTLAEGFGFSVKVNRGRSHERSFYAYPGFALRIGSRFEYVIEGHFAHFVSPGGYMVGALPVGGRLFLGSGRVVPYAVLGLGGGWTNLVKLDEIDQRFNFLVQGGVGVRTPISERQAWTAEIRWSHISNAGMSAPNLGLNSVVFLGGWRFR